MKSLSILFALIGLILGMGGGPLQAADEFDWKPKAKTVTVRISNWPMSRVLQELSTATGWRISYPSNLDQRVSVKFKDLSRSQGLRRLLGGLNHSLFTPPKGPVRLMIFAKEPGEDVTMIDIGAGSKPGEGVAKSTTPSKSSTTVARPRSVPKKTPTAPPSAQFSSVDTDQDGKISNEEREAARDERRREMIRPYDLNGDGNLDTEERKAMRERFTRKPGSPGPGTPP